MWRFPPGSRSHWTHAGCNDASVQDLFARYRQTHDRELRNELIEHHVELAESLARRYARRGEPFDDLRQVALVGLLKAVERFDADHGSAFVSFAVPTIRGELRRHFRDHGWAIKVPRRLQELRLEFDTLTSRVGHELGRSPTLAELAEAADTTVETVIQAMEVTEMYRLRSIDRPPTAGGSRTAADRLGGADPDLAGTEARVLLRGLLEELPTRDRRIVYLRYFEQMTQAEIAEMVGLSQMHVSRLLSRSLATLASLCTDAPPER